MSHAKGWFARLLALFGPVAPDESWRDLNAGGGISESDHFLLEAFPFERIVVNGNEAMTEWSRLRREGHCWPVIAGDDQELIRLAEQWSLDDISAEEILAKAAELRHPERLIAMRKAETEAAIAFLVEHGERVEDDRRPPLGEWPGPEEVAPNRGNSLTHDVRTGAPLERVHILLVPTTRGHEVPAWLRWGGWNECARPEYHVAALRCWHADFGAELVSLGGDVLELRVAQRPADREEALRLAREHYIYCNDIVDQGTENLSMLAAVLMASDWWFFWWD